jgi:predicted KAP-like P-loop ATPase
LGWGQEDSMVIALFGPWGSGKTSLLNMTVEYIHEISQDMEADQKPVIVRFNPWNFSDQDQIQLMFFTQLFSEIDSKASTWFKELEKNLGDSGSLLSATSAIPTAGPYLAVIGNLFQQLGDGKEDVTGLRAKIDEAFSELGRRIVIVLDDLDRLGKSEMKLVFQLIKLNANFPNTVFLLAADREVVEKSLDTEQGVRGRDYLEKIIQVGFDIPPIDETHISEILLEQLEVVLNRFPLNVIDKDRWGGLYHSGFRELFHSLRQVKRFINGLDFNLKLVSSEVDIVDFIGLEAIRIFEPDLYKTIAGNKHLFTSDIGKTNQDNLKEQFDTVFEGMGNQETYRQLLSSLFPKLKGVDAGTWHWRENQNIWRKDLRICSSDHFDTYFLMGVPVGRISQVEMIEIKQSMKNPSALVNTMRLYTRNGRFRQLLNLLIGVKNELSQPEIENLCSALIWIGEEVEDTYISAIDVGMDWQLARVIHLYISEIDPEKRCDWFNNQIVNGTSLSTQLTQIQIEEQKKIGQDFLFTVVCREKLTETWIDRVYILAKSQELSSAKGLNEILQYWAMLAPDQRIEIDRFISRLIQSVEGIAILLKAFLKTQKRYGIVWEQSVETTQRIDLDGLANFVDPNELLPSTDSETKDCLRALSEDKQEAFYIFLKAMDEDGRMLGYFFDSSPV